MERHSGLSSKFIWFFIAAVLGILLVAGIKFAASDADGRNTYGAVDDFNIAMRSCFPDQMSRYWDTSFQPDKANMPTENIAQGNWHSWEDYRESLEPYLKNTDLNEKLRNNSHDMSYSESRHKKLSNGMYFVSGTYHYNTMAQSKCTRDCASTLASHQGTSLETCSGLDMDDLLNLWYQDVKDVDLYTDNDEVTARELRVSYLIRSGYIVAFRYDDADADDSSLACVLLADLPHIYNKAQASAAVILVDNEKQAEAAAQERAQKAAAEERAEAQRQAQAQAEAAAREQARREAAEKEQARQRAEAAAQEQARQQAAAEEQAKQQAAAQKQQQEAVPPVRSAYAPDPSYVPQYSNNNATHTSDNTQDYTESDDPDDHDIEGYYEDYRDEFEDEDDAYDGYLDDEEWEDDY